MHLIFYMIGKIGVDITGVDIVGIPHQNMDVVTHLEISE